MRLKDCLQKEFILIWAIILLFNSIFAYSRDSCDGTLHIYLFTCSILLGLWLIVYKLGKLKFQGKLPNKYLICLFGILFIDALISIKMTMMLSDESIEDCYKDTTSTTTVEGVDLLSSTWLRRRSSTNINIKWRFSFAIVSIYGNNVIWIVGLSYGVFKYLISKNSSNEEKQEYMRIE